MRERPREVNRRAFVAGGVAALVTGSAAAAHTLRRTPPIVSENAGPPLRPPTASDDDDVFRRACVRCGLCGTVCENGCIRFFGADETAHGAFTPYLDVRRRSCTLCMRCTQICPSGALRSVEKDLDRIAKTIRIGRAVVDPEHCLSHLGRLCGYCHDACPIAEHAIRLAPPAIPVVLDDCVGCGRCVELCPQQPTAIRVERIS